MITDGKPKKPYKVTRQKRQDWIQQTAVNIYDEIDDISMKTATRAATAAVDGLLADLEMEIRQACSTQLSS